MLRCVTDIVMLLPIAILSLQINRLAVPTKATSKPILRDHSMKLAPGIHLSGNAKGDGCSLQCDRDNYGFYWLALSALQDGKVSIFRIDNKYLLPKYVSTSVVESHIGEHSGQLKIRVGRVT